MDDLSSTFFAPTQALRCQQTRVHTKQETVLHGIGRSISERGLRERLRLGLSVVQSSGSFPLALHVVGDLPPFSRSPLLKIVVPTGSVLLCAGVCINAICTAWLPIDQRISYSQLGSFGAAHNVFMSSSQSTSQQRSSASGSSRRQADTRQTGQASVQADRRVRVVPHSCTKSADTYLVDRRFEA